MKDDGTIEFTAAAQEASVRKLREILAQEPEPAYMTAAREEIRKMRTSTIIGFMDNPKPLAPVMAGWLGDDPSDDDFDVLGIRMALALADEIDRRIPVPA